MKVSLVWKEKMQFKGLNENNSSVVAFDSNDPKFGGMGKGTTPKEIFLQSIAGCSAMDVISILNTMRADNPEKFTLEINGELTKEHPKVFSKFEVVYNIEGTTDAKKLKRAVELSQTKYCGLSVMMKKIADFTYRVVLNGETIQEVESKPE